MPLYDLLPKALRWRLKHLNTRRRQRVMDRLYMDKTPDQVFSHVYE